MTSARRLYRLHLALAALGAAATILAAVVAVSRLQLGLPSAGEIAAACRNLLPAESGVAALLLLALLLLATAVAALALRSLLRQLWAQRRFLRALRPEGTIEIGDREVILFEGEQPQAFCAGMLRPRIYVSRVSLGLLSRSELRAVVAHEAHHQANRDPLRILMARVLADALFFLPGLRRLGRRYGELAELAADQAATRATDERSLASALLAFGKRHGSAGAVVGIAPERVDQLLGSTPRWQLPLSLFAGSLLSLGALLVLVLTFPALVERQGVNPAMLLAEACMVAMVAAPVAIAVFAVRLSRARLQRARAT